MQHLGVSRTMSLKSKAKAAKARAHVQRQREAEVVSAEKEFNRLTSMTAGFARTKRPNNFVAQKAEPMRRRSDLQDIPKAMAYTATESTKVRPALSPDMQVRDDVARAAIERKKQRVAPVGNKMGYQYLIDLDCADLMKGLLRRR